MLLARILTNLYFGRNFSPPACRCVAAKCIYTRWIFHKANELEARDSTSTALPRPAHIVTPNFTFIICIIFLKPGPQSPWLHKTCIRPCLATSVLRTSNSNVDISPQLQLRCPRTLLSSPPAFSQRRFTYSLQKLNSVLPRPPPDSCLPNLSSCSSRT